MSAGFTYPEVLNMTLGQIKLFSEAAAKRSKVRMRENVISALAGARYDEQGLAKLMRELE